MNETPIDIVLPWVDFNDPAWRQDLEKYKTDAIDFSQYRDWNNLEYVFRGIEKYMPWVNKIYFITCGHLPRWLDKNHPKLIIIEHTHFLKKDYLPLFSIIPIEINLHRIKGLS